MYVLSTIFNLRAPPSDMLQAHYVITIHLNQLAVMRDNRFAYIKGTKLYILVEKLYLKFI